MRISLPSLWLSAALAIVATSSLSQVVDPKDQANQATKRALDEIQKDAKRDFRKASEALRAFDPDGMNPENRATWTRLTRANAIRTGNARLLRELKDFEDPFSTITLARVIMASGHLEVGDFAGATAELSHIHDIERINPRERRRYWALKARIAQLTGDEEEEVAALSQIARELAQWPTPACQSCHDDPKDPKALPTLDLRKLWFIDRYVSLLGKNDRASRLERGAKKRITTDPRDMEARILLYAALRASAAADEAEKALQEIKGIGRLGDGDSGPRMIFMWP